MSECKDCEQYEHQKFIKGKNIGWCERLLGYVWGGDKACRADEEEK